MHLFFLKQPFSLSHHVLARPHCVQARSLASCHHVITPPWKYAMFTSMQLLPATTVVVVNSDSQPNHQTVTLVNLAFCLCIMKVLSWGTNVHLFALISSAKPSVPSSHKCKLCNIWNLSCKINLQICCWIGWLAAFDVTVIEKSYDFK